MDLTTGKESNLILRFATPMLLGNVFQQSYNIVDRIIVGKYIGDAAIGAIGESFPIIFALISFIIGVASGSTIIISQYFGAKQIVNVQKTIDTMFIFLFFAAITVTIVGLLFVDDIFKLIKVPDEIMHDAITYINVYIGGIILFFGYNATAAILRGLGDSITPLVFLILSTLMNIGLDFLFIGVFEWGIAGAAYATIIAQGGAFITAVIYLNKKHDIMQFRIKGLVFDHDIFKKSIKIGLPSGLQTTFVSIGMIALMRIVNDFGHGVVAAYSIASVIDSFAVIPAMTFAQALSTFVGQNLGANKSERVKKGFETTLLMTSLISVVVTGMVYLFGRNLVGLFTDSPEVIQYGVNYLLIVSSFYLIFTTMFVCNGVMRGAGDTIIPLLVSILALWVIRIPVSWILSRGPLGVDGIWWGIPIAWAVGASFAYIYYRTGKWKLKAVVKYN